MRMSFFCSGALLHVVAVLQPDLIRQRAGDHCVVVGKGAVVYVAVSYTHLTLPTSDLV